MSKNCLVSKFFGGVNNPDFEKLGCLKVNVVDGLQMTIRYADNVAWTDGDYELSSGVSKVSESSANKTFSGTGLLFVKNKYNIKVFAIPSNTYKDAIKVEDLYYCPLINVDVFSGNFKNLSSLSQLGMLPSSLTKLSINEKDDTNHMTGDISALSGLSNIEKLYFQGCRGITGTMTQLATLFPSLNDLGTMTGIQYAGSVEDFVAVRRSQGVTSGSVDTKAAGYSTITFNGESMSTNTSSKPFSWTATTITYNGVTINA